LKIIINHLPLAGWLLKKFTAFRGSITPQRAARHSIDYTQTVLALLEMGKEGEV
jgi:hypothetical protein